MQCLAGLNADNINARSRRLDRTELNWTELTGSSQFSTGSQLVVFSRRDNVNGRHRMHVLRTASSAEVCSVQFSRVDVNRP